MADEPPKKHKRRVLKGDLTKAERICEKLREIQWKCNCSTKTLQSFLDALHGELGDLIRECDTLPLNVKDADAKMRRMVGISEML